MCSCYSILECCVMFSGVKLSIRSFVLLIEKKEESAGALNAYIYLIMDAQLNIQNGTYISAVY